ncbi:MAG: ferredoxin [Clostridia bacterium]|jgi:MinD superfamily P-loop ATPase|nr:ferredoxin [Clostridia bacterium]
MPRRINESDCAACGTCQRVCLVGCITQRNDKIILINKSACVDCGACQLACPKKCISQD